MSLKVAILGSGISGLAAAHSLRGHADISLFEAGSYFGGHTHTVDVTLPTAQGPVTHGVDTGFLVLNSRTYPQLIALLADLQVPTSASDMSFSAQVFGPTAADQLEWSGSSLNTVFAQRRNLLRPAFWRMLRDLLRFNALTTALAQHGSEADMALTIGDFLQRHGFSAAFCDWYFLPMMACIWSCPTTQMLQFPVSTMVRFCHNHGLLQITGRPQWRTVAGGARQYVARIVMDIADRRLNTPVRRILDADAQGVQIQTDLGTERFDRVIIASHADQALALLAQPSMQERQTLGAFRFHSNQAVLHTDSRMLPQHPAAWAAWNYERAQHSAQEDSQVCLHYWLNRLQPLPWQQPVLVSLNPIRPIAPDTILGAYQYDHPVFDRAAVAAQSHMLDLQGRHGRYYAGAWMGYGFHEDGLKAGQAAAAQLLADVGRAAGGKT